MRKQIALFHAGAFGLAEVPHVIRPFLGFGVSALRRCLKGNQQESAQMEESRTPVFSFGVIADIQYADKEDGTNFHGTRQRYYRNSLVLLRNALRQWNGETVQPSFILQLGDIIDGFNAKLGCSDEALSTVISEFDSCSAKVHHVWGNHEFYNFSRRALFSSALNSEGAREEERDSRIKDVYAYHFSPAAGFRFVVLDSYDLSIIGQEENSEKYNQSYKILTQHNPHQELNQPPGIYPMDGRFVKFNGGISQEQLAWLDGLLTSADEKEEKVIVMSHIPVHPSSSDGLCFLWNYKEVLSLLHSHKSVVCVLAGHDHDGGYYRDEEGVHHVTLQGVIETPPGCNAFGTIYVFDDKMILKGEGKVLDRELMYQ